MTEKTQEVCGLLDRMGISYRLNEHEAVYTIDDLLKLNLTDAARDAIAKNLFVRDDKKRNYYLLVVRQEKKAELKVLKEKIRARPLSFASEEDLQSILGIPKGSVTPFGIINDEARKVRVVLDSDFAGCEIGVHPNENTATVFLQTDDLVKIIGQHGNSVEFAEI